MNRSSTQPLWSPTLDQVASSGVMQFCAKVNARYGLELTSSQHLHQFSIERMEDFWSLLWDDCGVISQTRGARVLSAGDQMPGAQFFPDARLNFAQNLLRREDDGAALVFWGEDKVSSRMSWRQLNALVSRLQQFMQAQGIAPHDRVAAMLPNLPQAIAVMLAASSLGAVFSSCSPDFGERGVLDRFGQIEPKLLFVVDGYWYNGKKIQITDKLIEITRQLPSACRVVVIPYLEQAEEVAQAINAALGTDHALSLNRALDAFAPRPITYAQLPFSHPLYILFSSGTTGVPKCIVHSAGGTLLQHLKEHRLHYSLSPQDKFFYFTTLGWMMWNWLVSGLASGATLLLYDGSPFAPNNEILFDYAVAEGMTIFGTSAKYIDSVRKTGWEPKTTHDLSRIRLLTSTGSPLAPESFEFVYASISRNVHLASISGGTDIVSCFVGGDPTLPVYKGEIQAPGLGMAVQIWDDEGQPVGAGVKGELVCTKPFPSMPVMFWNDEQGAKYKAAYFERFDNIWCHGDFAEWTPQGGMIIHGRSDATLNPGGVRIGTAEVYAQVERIPQVLEALCIGQDWDNDVRVVLFVRLSAGAALDDALILNIKTMIKNGASPRHVPAKIIQVADIPRTKSGKITELAVRDVVHGRLVKNKEALANPEALDLFVDLPDLRS